jgi:hypothetical protein
VAVITIEDAAELTATIAAFRDSNAMTAPGTACHLLEVAKRVQHAVRLPSNDAVADCLSLLAQAYTVSLSVDNKSLQGSVLMALDAARVAMAYVITSTK